MREHLGPTVTRCCGYGHIGDGNLHLNITTPEFEKVMFRILCASAYITSCLLYFKGKKWENPLSCCGLKMIAGKVWRIFI